MSQLPTLCILKQRLSSATALFAVSLPIAKTTGEPHTFVAYTGNHGCRPNLFMRLLCILVLLTASLSQSIAGHVTIGTGTGTWAYPLTTSNHDVRTQVIYLASEVGAAGYINGLALDVSTLPGQSLGNFAIRMKLTGLSSYATKSWESSGWTVCYQANTTVSAMGWTTFNFTTPFYFDGVSNLMVDFSFDNSSSSTDGYCRYSIPSGGATRTIYFKTNSQYGNPLAWSGTANPTPSSITITPNIRLSIDETTATPVFSPPGGNYTTAQQVAITCTTPGAVIHYTTNGNDPTEADPFVSSGNTVIVPVSTPTTLKAKAWAVGYQPSPVASAQYRQPVAATPVLSPVGGNYTEAQQVTLTCTTPGAAIHYTTNGSNPTEADPYVTSGNSVLVPVSTPTTLKAKAWAVGYDPSAVVSALYRQPVVAIPVLSPGGGNYTEAQQVTVTCTTPGANIHYTTNANVPTTIDPFVTSGNAILVPVSTPTILTVKAFATGYDPSAVVTAQYRQPVAAAPVFSPPGGVYTESQQVTVTCTTPGATIHYTTNGNDPTELDPIISNGGTIPVPVTPSTTLKAKAWVAGHDPSPVASAQYRELLVWHVSPSGSNANDGSSWQLAKKSVSAALAASIAGDEIWVAAGVYIESITMKDGVALYGGFNGTETAREQRNWQTNKSILDANQNGAVVTSPIGVTNSACIDGFTIRNGKGTPGSGINCWNSSPTITNNTISGNSSSAGGGISCIYSSAVISNNTITANSVITSGGGIYCYRSDLTITNNIITNNTFIESDQYSPGGGGIYCSNSNPDIINNSISSNSRGGIVCDLNSNPAITNNTISYNDGSGIGCRNNASPTIANNNIWNNTGSGIGCHTSNATITLNNISRNVNDGVYCMVSNPYIAKNTISGNLGRGISWHRPEGQGGISGTPGIANNIIASNQLGIYLEYSSPPITNNIIRANNSPNSGGGIYCWKSSPAIRNNTIVANNAVGEGGGISCYESLQPPLSIVNNIVAFNSSGIYNYSEYSFQMPYTAFNCVFGNTAYNYYGLSAGEGSISADPLFVNMAGGDYHLQAGSPCINAGDDTSVQPGWVDMDGQPRQNGVVDIGADEYWLFQQIASSGAKGLADGSAVHVTGAVVTAVFGDTFYMEAVNRSAGIMVQKAGHGMAVGQVVSVEGTLETTADEERYIAAVVLEITGASSVQPLVLVNRSVGGEPWLLSPTGGQKGTKDSFGLNNIGLLIKTTGKVTSVDSASGIFYLDDGSNRMDGSGSVGIRVKAGSIALPSINDIVTVTGISSCYKTGNDLYPLIKLTATPVVVD